MRKIEFDCHLHFNGGKRILQTYITTLYKNLLENRPKYLKEDPINIFSLNHGYIFPYEEMFDFSKRFHFNWISAFGVKTSNGMEFGVFNLDKNTLSFLKDMIYMRIKRHILFLEYINENKIDIYVDEYLLKINGDIIYTDIEDILELLNKEKNPYHKRLEEYVKDRLPDWKPTLKYCLEKCSNSNLYIINPRMNTEYSKILNNNNIKGVILNTYDNKNLKMLEYLYHNYPNKDVLHGTGQTF